MSTAEAVSAGYAACCTRTTTARASGAEHLVQHLVGTALKDVPDDVKQLRHYFNHVVRGRRGRALEGPLRGAARCCA